METPSPLRFDLSRIDDKSRRTYRESSAKELRNNSKRKMEISHQGRDSAAGIFNLKPSDFYSRGASVK